MAQAGINGLDFHGGLGVCGAPLFNGKYQRYTPICPANAADERARIYTAAPEYYGLYLASRMGPGRFLPVTLSSDRNVAAHAVLGRDGKIRIAVIERDDTSGAPVRVTVTVGRSDTTAEVLRLTGNALGSKQGVAIQGATVDRTGRLPQRAPDRVAVTNGTLSLNLASGSAALITLDA
jgi:Glycosyl hydrolase family 79 C-terminal beta domain